MEVWDLSQGPRQMDYSRLNPKGRKRVTPEDAAPPLRFGPRSTFTPQKPSPAIQSAMAAMEEAKRSRSLPSSSRDAACDGRGRMNPFTQQPRRSERTNSCEGHGEKKKEVRRVRFTDPPTCASVLTHFSPLLPTAPKPPAAERFVRWRHQSVVRRRMSSAAMETGREKTGGRLDEVARGAAATASDDSGMLYHG
eukprot:TRINITY_DN20874_c1_g1_i1.p1 TRINITY_DN20874_c1_g1~~TRINITY_DN20874_c1_g1_i1.p1  ORF type:complete len:225 (-),score=25.95 TRINITY_DN20874_c1_g1_i1:153-734(-)